MLILVKVDNDYKSRTGQSHIPVQSDDAPVDDPINPETADSDETLGKSYLERIQLQLLILAQPRMMPMLSIRTM